MGKASDFWASGVRLFNSREFRLFLVVGLTQFLLDAGLFYLLHRFSDHVTLANVLARASAALVGFWLNRTLTFSQARDGAVHAQLLRLVMLWLLLTVLSTALIAGWKMLLVPVLPMPVHEATLAGKIVVEALLVLLSFQLARRWVYR